MNFAINAFDVFIVFVVLGAVAILLARPIRNNQAWRAMVTPLASIIGSGFLVVAPLLATIAGNFAVIAMVSVVVLAFFVGSVVRFNIIHAEPMLEGREKATTLQRLSRLSNIALTVAYVISIAFYIRLLASFALSLTPWNDKLTEDVLATVILAAIALVGVLRGLKGLEWLETFAVSIKLSIIAALLAGLFYSDASNFGWLGNIDPPSADMVTRLRMLAGMLLVIQGFETSRYLGSEYSADLRVKTMRRAQILSGVIYVGFVLLITPLLVDLPEGATNEAAIIGLSARITTVMPYILVVAALMSQFSAAIADTLGAGGLVSEETGRKISPRMSYPILIAVSIALFWVFDILQIISIASRTFAFYYLVQTLIALVIVYRNKSMPKRTGKLFGFAILAIVLAAIVLFALPVE